MIYQFVSELRYFKPRVWRRFQISPEATVAEFAYALMSMYRMQGSHLYAVSIPVSSGKHGMSAVTFGIPSVYEDLPGVIDASSVTLESVLRHVEGMTLVLEYDFGDSWEVQATLEKRELAFDSTYLDLAKALNIPPLKGKRSAEIVALVVLLEAILDASIEKKDNRFYFVSKT